MIKRILVTASTFPASDTDHVPAFVKDQVIALKKEYPDIALDVLAPHNAYSNTKKITKHQHYTEHRFHYFLPFKKWELLAGRGIAPALKKNPLLYIQVPFLIIAEIFVTRRLIKNTRPDVVYAHWFTPQAITAALACKSTKTPFVFTSHSGDVIVLKKVPFAKKIVTWVCRQATVYTAVSGQTADKLFSMLPNDQGLRDKLEVIPMGTRLSKPLPATKKPQKVVELFFIGRLVSIKGVDYLLKALGGLKDDYKFRLTIAGDGQQRAELEKLTESLDLSDRVEFVGYVSGKTKDSLFHRSDIVCIPSIKEGENTEGLPVTLMETLANGKIVIASDVTGAQEFMTDEVDGFIFQQAEVDDHELAA
jgi:glycosyltransferase involved in cell wall biosynthesis